MKKKFSHALDQLTVLLNIGDKIDINDKKFKNISHYIKHIKKLFLNLKPIMQTGENISKYIDDIEKYYNSELELLFNLLSDYRKQLFDIIEETRQVK